MQTNLEKSYGFSYAKRFVRFCLGSLSVATVINMYYESSKTFVLFFFESEISLARDLFLLPERIYWRKFTGLAFNAYCRYFRLAFSFGVVFFPVWEKYKKREINPV